MHIANPLKEADSVLLLGISFDHKESSSGVALIWVHTKLEPDWCDNQFYPPDKRPHITFNTILIYCGLWRYYWCESHSPLRASHLAGHQGNKGLLTQLINFSVTQPELFHPKQRGVLAFLLTRAQASTCTGNPIIIYMCCVECLWQWTGMLHVSQ